jgi:hypothetical protein
MGATEIIGVAASLSLFAGWRLYACVLACGLAMRFGLIALPVHFAGLSALASPWVLAVAGFGLVAEFFADKVALLDSVWDAVHSFIRPLGGAMLALAVIDPGDTQWQIITLLLGGSAALASHAAKAGGRALVNMSPEPVSNIMVSTAEDGVTAGGLYLALAHPALAGGIAALVLLVVGILAIWCWRRIGGFWVRWKAWGDRPS